MPSCSCDGPPHSYDPSWCGAGKQYVNGVEKPIDYNIAAAEAALKAAKLAAIARKQGR